MSPSARLESLLPPKIDVVPIDKKWKDPKTVSDDNKSEDCEVLPINAKIVEKELPVFVKQTKVPPRFLRRKSLSPWARLEALAKDDERKKD